jgi:hypothetical protein
MRPWILRAHDDARPIEHEIGRVEEHDLADLRVERVEPKPSDRGTLLGGGDGELELDRIRALEQAHQLPELRIAQRGPNCGLGGHTARSHADCGAGHGARMPLARVRPFEGTWGDVQGAWGDVPRAAPGWSW